ncbi:MAG: hypothetical protein CM1200mP30_26340 [Pseudomonadota bacterium]|nr:MAG: hypothetical protein CM1200mP30_26340 [Pseudomonadota bacterium]
MSEEFRIEKDSMGEVRVPADALYGAQTQRAVDNFPVSGICISRSLIHSLGVIKQAAAKVNAELGNIPQDVAHAIQLAAQEVIDGKLDNHFPIDIYQTGSGTSSNMNTNEVIAGVQCSWFKKFSVKVHPNDHINFGKAQMTHSLLP